MLLVLLTLFALLIFAFAFRLLCVESGLDTFGIAGYELSNVLVFLMLVFHGLVAARQRAYELL